MQSHHSGRACSRPRSQKAIPPPSCWRWTTRSNSTPRPGRLGYLACRKDGSLTYSRFNLHRPGMIGFPECHLRMTTFCTGTAAVQAFSCPKSGSGLCVALRLCTERKSSVWRASPGRSVPVLGNAGANRSAFLSQAKRSRLEKLRPFFVYLSHCWTGLQLFPCFDNKGLMFRGRVGAVPVG